MRGFTLVELLIVVVATTIFVGVLVTGFLKCSPEWAFTLASPEELHIITNPKTGETSECLRHGFNQKWLCRPIQVQAKSAEKE